MNEPRDWRRWDGALAGASIVVMGKIAVWFADRITPAMATYLGSGDTSQELTLRITWWAVNLTTFILAYLLSAGLYLRITGRL